MDDSTGINTGSQLAVIDVHEPFTLPERFQQLAEIDNDIIKLLTLANDIIQPLSTPDGASGPGAASTADAHTETQVAAFKEAMDSFLTTLHSVDVRLKRQIWGLEEAGLISLKESKPFEVSLEPNGVGDIGSLDVGWLNSRSNKVDRDMETELWSTMRATVERLGQNDSDQRETGIKK
ncbi:hypothetical protein Sste5346_000670 [Sporothrix stenoceras]|uniref:Mediator of RNA polymerase II transcription subunit 11 n=1 Tax=Sporothrix stenoceras TaxID=5173 RepID=A0ABR3ZRQ1_9PEZI